MSTITVWSIQSPVMPPIAGDNEHNERARAYRVAMSGEVKDLLSVGNDAKTVKGEKVGVLTGVMYLAPAQVSGTEMCPARTKGCTAVCLFSAGHGAYRSVRDGRLRKTYQFLHRRPEFMIALHNDIAKLVRSAKRREMVPAVRLNGTSDVAWESIPFVDADGVEHQNIFAANPNVQFYDYTKVRDRVITCAGIPNYHLTFSLAETRKSMSDALFALENKVSVSVVFDKLPETYLGHKVLDGDENDVRFWNDENGPYIIGLKPKGQASKDSTGFVVRLSEVSA